jgi:hypothetical protein
MAMTLAEEIDALTAARQEEERLQPGCFWGGGGLKLSRAEAEVFAIDYGDFPRMQSVLEAWYEFLGLIVGSAVCL